MAEMRTKFDFFMLYVKLCFHLIRNLILNQNKISSCKAEVAPTFVFTITDYKVINTIVTSRGILSNMYTHLQTKQVLNDIHEHVVTSDILEFHKD